MPLPGQRKGLKPCLHNTTFFRDSTKLLFITVGHAELVSASVRSHELVKARSEILKQVQDDFWRYLLFCTLILGTPIQYLCLQSYIH